MLIDGFTPGGQRQQPLQGSDSFVCHFLIAGDLQVRAPVDNAHAKGLFDPAYVFIKGAEYGNQILYTFSIYDSLCFFTHWYLLSAPRFGG